MKNPFAFLQGHKRNIAALITMTVAAVTGLDAEIHFSHLIPHYDQAVHIAMWAAGLFGSTGLIGAILGGRLNTTAQDGPVP